MQLSRKQIILIVSLSGVAAILIVGLILFLNYGNKRDPVPQEPALPIPTDTPEPEKTPTPVPTPLPTDTPAPTPYYLPLVPEGDTRTPTPAPTATATPAPSPTPAPEAAVPRIHSDPHDGVYNDHIREFMAIGTQNGEALAVLLVHVEPPQATVVAIPCETLAQVYTLGPDTTVKSVDAAPLSCATARAETAREGCWNLIWAVKNLVGFRAPAYLCVDFNCMDAFFSFVPALSAGDMSIDLSAFRRMAAESGETRANSMALFGVGLARYLGKVSLWDMPAFRSATSGSFTSSLSVFELIALTRALKEVREYRIDVLSTQTINGVRMLSDAASMPF